MATKAGMDQHNMLHRHWPNDCCLCRQESRIRELEAELAKCRWHKAHEEADAEIELQMKRALKAELERDNLRAQLARAEGVLAQYADKIMWAADFGDMPGESWAGVGSGWTLAKQYFKEKVK